MIPVTLSVLTNTTTDYEITYTAFDLQLNNLGNFIQLSARQVHMQNQYVTPATRGYGFYYLGTFFLQKADDEIFGTTTC